MYQPHRTRANRFARQWILSLCDFLFSIFCRRQVRGIENIPKNGPLLVVSNHVSYADQYLLVISLNQEMIFMAKEELFRYQPLKFLVESFGAFPVRRGGMDRKALSEAGQVLDQGLTLFMFPEGTRSKNGKLKPAYPGTALIALHNRVPILPVGITGMEFAEKDPFWLVFHRPQITVNIGRPFHLNAPSSKPNKTQLKELAGYIMEQIAALLPPRYRGHYGDGGG